MKTRNLTCIVCPKGCPLVVAFDEEGKIADITGYTCKRGIAYATDECTAPKRTVTTTVRCESGAVVPVKTASVVPKEKMIEVMKHINRTVAKDGLKIGDVVIEDVAGCGVAVIATANS